MKSAPRTVPRVRFVEYSAAAGSAMEKRNPVRYRLDLPVTFRWTEKDGSAYLGVGFTRDISAVAMFVVTRDCPPPDALVHCDVMLPRVRDGSRMQIKSCGQVLRSERAGYGNGGYGFAIFGDMLLLCRELSQSELEERNEPDGENVATKQIRYN
jgi:hypothetical protein